MGRTNYRECVQKILINSLGEKEGDPGEKWGMSIKGRKGVLRLKNSERWINWSLGRVARMMQFETTHGMQQFLQNLAFQGSQLSFRTIKFAAFMVARICLEV